MKHYIKFSPKGVPLSHLKGDLGGFNTAEASALNGKPYLAEATIEGYEPFDQATQIRTGPVYDGTAIKYTVRDKTADELETYKDKEATGILTQRNVKALVAMLNDGSFVPGSNYMPAQIKTILKAKL